MDLFQKYIKTTTIYTNNWYLMFKFSSLYKKKLYIVLHSENLMVSKDFLHSFNLKQF